LQDPMGISLFAKYGIEKPDQRLEDGYGLAEVRKAAAART
jgi:hypothetical protein